MKLYMHQFLSKTGSFRTKKAIVDALRNKEITVDDRIVKDMYFQINPFTRIVKHNGKQLQILRRFAYVVMNKPKGYLCSKLTPNDIEWGKKSVFDLIGIDANLDPLTRNALFCVGRLDEDSSGLLIMTNDGGLGNKVTSPDSKIEKTYRVTLANPITDKIRKQVEAGVTIELEENNHVSKYKTKPCKVKLLAEKELEITVIEGKKREIKRIFEAIGNKVLSLERIRIGKVDLDKLNLEKGKYIVLDKLEV